MKQGIMLGCGPKPFHEQHIKLMETLGGQWYAADLYCTGEGILQMDARNLKFPDDHFDYIYASHLLEHLPHVETLTILKHWHAKLKSKGKVIINVPDLEYMAQLLLGTVKNERYCDFSGDRGMLNILYGNQNHEGEYHKAGFTDYYLKHCLKEAGFVDISIRKEIEGHEMQCLIAVAKKL